MSREPRFPAPRNDPVFSAKPLRPQHRRLSRLGRDIILFFLSPFVTPHRFTPEPLVAFSPFSSQSFNFRPSTLNRSPITPFPATPTSPLQIAENPTTLNHVSANLDAASSISPLFATLTKNTQGWGTALLFVLGKKGAARSTIRFRKRPLRVLAGRQISCEKCEIRFRHRSRWIRLRPRCSAENRRWTQSGFRGNSSGRCKCQTPGRAETCVLKRIVDECSRACRDFITAKSRTLRLLSFLTVHTVSEFRQTRNFHDVFAWEKLK